MNNRTFKQFLFFLILVSLTGNISFAQTQSAKEVLEKVSHFYENSTAYHIEVNYNMHRGLTGNKITESYNGSMTKNGDFSKFEVLGSEVIQFPEIQLIINNEEKQVLYTKKNANAFKNSPLNVDTFLEYFDKYSLTTKGNLIICEMVPSRAIAELPYGKVVLYIDKDKSRLEKQELFFTNLIPFVDKQSKTTVHDYGRLVILFKYKEISDKAITYKLSDYLSFSANNEVLLSKKYTNYNLVKDGN